jgi:hypothetical protein
MSAYKDALHLTSAEQGPRLALAAEILAEGSGVVVLDGVLALRPASDKIQCEVISSGTTPPHAQVEAAKRLLLVATLGCLVDSHKCDWLLVDEYGTGTVELWREG